VTASGKCTDGMSIDDAAPADFTFSVRVVHGEL
jgi:hypothetical protein